MGQGSSSGFTPVNRVHQGGSRAGTRSGSLVLESAAQRTLANMREDYVAAEKGLEEEGLFVEE